MIEKRRESDREMKIEREREILWLGNLERNRERKRERKREKEKERERKKKRAIELNQRFLDMQIKDLKEKEFIKCTQEECEKRESERDYA